MGYNTNARFRAGSKPLTREAVLDFLQQSFDLDAERNTPGGTRFLEAGGGKTSLQLALIKPGGVSDFVNVVIFRRHPEDGDGFDAGERELVATDVCERFIKA